MSADGGGGGCAGHSHVGRAGATQSMEGREGSHLGSMHAMSVCVCVWKPPEEHACTAPNSRVSGDARLHLAVDLR